MTEEHPPDSDESDGGDDSGDGATKSTATRWNYTNDLIAGLLVLFAVAITSVYVARGDAVPLWLSAVDGLAVVTAVVWAFGKGAFKAASKTLGNE